MELDEQTLQYVAREGEMDYNKWPTIIEPLLDRLNHIVYNDFRIPRPYPTILQHPDISPEQTQENLHTETLQTTTTATSQAPATPIRTLPPVPPFPNSSATSTTHIPDSLPPSQVSPSDPLVELPATLLQMLNGINHILRSAFSERPPHTVQRLAELTLDPTKHYKSLPAWLRAVDRVVSVSTSADVFPLSDAPPIVNGVNGDAVGGILWNNSTSDSVRNGYDAMGLGSDESLGGALLTPIPWLKNGVLGSEDDTDVATQDIDDELDGEPLSNDSILGESIDLPSTAIPGNGSPFVPEREDGAVTQGELIRMEQEAGVVPVSRAQQSTGLSMAGTEDDDDLDLEEELGELMPHARGPNMVGTVDMGKVDGRDMQVSIGSPPQKDGTHDVNVNDAQDVLNQGVDDTRSNSRGDNNGFDNSNNEGFELVSKPDLDQEMAMNDDEIGTEQSKRSNEDADIVLVDADGKMEDENDNVAREEDSA